MNSALPTQVQTIQNDLLALCQSGRLLCLYPHIHADGDALGACAAMALALEQLGARVAILTEEAIPEKLQRLLPARALSLWLPPGRKQSKAAQSACAALVLDCSPGSRLGERNTWVQQTEAVYVVDHHVRDAQFVDGERVWRDTSAPATCALVGAWLQDWEQKQLLTLDQDIATALLIGLLTDTGRFAYSNTAPQTLRLAADLLQKGAPLSELSHELFELQSENHLRLLGWIGSQTQFFADGKAAYCILPYFWIQEHRPEGMDFEGLAAEMRNVEGVEAALLLRARADGKYKASLRSQSCFDSQAFASRFGGGGHVRASGFEVTEQQVQTLPDCFAQAVQEAVEGQKRAVQQACPDPVNLSSESGTQTANFEGSATSATTTPSTRAVQTSAWRLEQDPQGILNVYKPAGLSSFAVVAILRRITGIRKIGHCGTLDPFAEGVLPIAVGRATSAVAYMQAYDKTYQARLVLGAETDSGDCTGEPTEVQPVSKEQLAHWNTPGAQQWETALQSMLQEREQYPPMYSAVKHRGQPLYRLARQGIEVERKPRPIQVYDVRPLQPPRKRMDGSETVELEAQFHVSKGTYIRSLCALLARKMGSVGHLDRLIRISCGPFVLEDSVRLETLTSENWKQFLLPTHLALPKWEVLDLSRKQAQHILQGKFIADLRVNPDQRSGVEPGSGSAAGDEAGTELRYVLLFFEDRFLGIGRCVQEENRWGIRAERMFTTFDTSQGS